MQVGAALSLVGLEERLFCQPLVDQRDHQQQQREGTRDEELDRLLDLGATVVEDHRGKYGPGTAWVVLADPEGNEFCLLRTRLDPL